MDDHTIINFFTTAIAPARQARLRKAAFSPRDA